MNRTQLIDRQRSLKLINSFDRDLLLLVNRFQVPSATAFFKAITNLGNTSSWIALGTLLLASGGTATLHAHLVIASTLIAAFFTQLLKRTLRRIRPSQRIQGFSALVDDPDVFSFPSGHTAVAVGAATALTGYGVFLGPVFWFFSASVGLSRIYLGAHYPFDVGAGALIGVLSGYLARLMM